MYQCRCDVKTACNDVIYIVVHYKHCDLHIVIVYLILPGILQKLAFCTFIKLLLVTQHVTA